MVRLFSSSSSRCVVVLGVFHKSTDYGGGLATPADLPLACCLLLLFVHAHAQAGGCFKHCLLVVDLVFVRVLISLVVVVVGCCLVVVWPQTRTLSFSLLVFFSPLSI